MSLGKIPPSSPNPNNIPITGNNNSGNAGKPNQQQSLNAANVNNAQKEASQQKDSASASADAVNKAKTTPVKDAAKNTSTTTATDGLPDSSPDGTTSRFESINKQKAVEENMAKVDGSNIKKSEDSGSSSSSGSSGSAISPYTQPGGAGNGGIGGIGSNSGLANINNGTQIGTQINGDIGNKDWTSFNNVTEPSVPPITQPDSPPVLEVPKDDLGNLDSW